MQPPSSRRARLFSDERAIFVLGVIGVTFLLIAIGTAVDSRVRSWSSRDLGRRSALLWRAVTPDLATMSPEVLVPRFEALADDPRVMGLLVCSPDHAPISNKALDGVLRCQTPLALAATAAEGSSIAASLSGQEVVVTAHRFGPANRNTLLIVQDRSVLWTRRRSILQLTLMAAGIGLLGIGAISWWGACTTRRRERETLRAVFRRAAEGERVRDFPVDLQPIVRDLNDTVRRIRKQRESMGALSGPQRLRDLVAEKMPDTQLILIANREPYIHLRAGDEINLLRPASGLVTGLEPLLRACGGIWIAHGSGSADRETADAKGRLAVPPGDPEYVLRRIWLTPQEEEGYYYGFANEGLWPLCHIAHTRPTFRASDWVQYQRVNRKFAEAAAEEARKNGVLLVQDYHFALVPRELCALIRDAVIGLFWHIPWPNDEVVGICPWKRELLAGMLAADVVGFHTRYHCLNFLSTVGRYLEARVDLEAMSVEYQGHITRVKPYPISVEWPHPSATREEGFVLRDELRIPPDAVVGIGVDRADYTKGLLERVAAINTLLTEHPELVGKFVFMQIAAPSRTHIKRYRDLVSELEEAVVEVNRKFGHGDYLPIVLRVKHFNPEEVRQVYAMADLAIITPLHDGMNLVAKEYVASCADGRGALVLSIFAGAAKELDGALLVNPYDSSEVAAAVHRAVTMSDQERAERMQRMRAAVERRTIFDWSAALLSDLGEVAERRNEPWRAAR
jgi:trehalose 6-phosphate synthase